MASGNTIIVSADFGHALFVLEKHVKAASELTAAITAINEHRVDLDDDAMAEIEQEKFRHRVAADAIAEALQVICRGGDTHNPHQLNATELNRRKCYCGAAVEIEGASHE